MGYGIYQHGHQQYGWGVGQQAEDAVTEFRILYAVATSFTTVKFEYSEAPRITDLPTLLSPYGQNPYSRPPYGKLYGDPLVITQKSALDPDNYTITSDPAGPDPDGITITDIRQISATIFEMTVTGMVSEVNYTLTAAQTIANVSGTTTLGETVAAIGYGNTALFVGFGIHPYIISVTNPSNGLLKVIFNEAMDVNFAFRNTSSYNVSPVVNSPHLYIQSVTVNEATPDTVWLNFIGGGGQYALVAHGLKNLSGIYISTRPYYFHITKYVEDELLNTLDYFFETNLGAIRLSMGTLTARKVEDLAILRAQDTGFEAQFQNIAKALEKAGITEDDRKLKLFKR